MNRGLEKGRAFWEYKVLDCRGQENEKDQDDLNELGMAAWELVSVSKGIMYLKRIKYNY